MSAETPLEYFGLPLPTIEEAEFLRLELDLFMMDISLAADLVDRSYTEIFKPMRRSQIHFEEYEAPQELSCTEIDQYNEGFQEGFEFIIGAMAYLATVRSSEPNVKQMLLRSDNIFRNADSYIKERRAQNTDRVPETPSLDAMENGINANAYLKAAANLRPLLQSRLLPEERPDSLTFYNDGVVTGSRYAITICLLPHVNFYTG